VIFIVPVRIPPAMPRRPPLRSLRGLGQNDSIGTDFLAGADLGLSDTSGTADTSSGTDLSQMIAALGTAANSAVSAYNKTQAPYVLPGTNVLYSPATGQIAGASPIGVTASQLSTSLLPIAAIVAVVAFVLIMGRK
jgi:hypothetical protein